MDYIRIALLIGLAPGVLYSLSRLTSDEEDFMSRSFTFGITVAWLALAAIQLTQYMKGIQ